MNDGIFITGTGIISAIGKNKAEVVASLKNRQTGIAAGRYLAGGEQFLLGEVKCTDEELAELSGVDRTIPMNRTALLGIVAASEAIREAKLSAHVLKTIPFINGTTVGGMEKSEAHYARFIESAQASASFSIHDCGSTTELIADHFGGFKSLTTISTACSSAANAILRGADMIRSGNTDIVIVGGCECLSRFHVSGFNSLMILDKELCKPFDESRKGLNLGEGAAFLVLESAASVERRAVEPLAELSGCGNKCDAFHQTASSPEGEGAYLAMKEALEEAGVSPDEINYVNAHGTGTPNNDASESEALKRIFPHHLPPVSSTKGFTGHTTSASGSIEAVICILAMRENFIPVNLNWQKSGEDTIVPFTAESDFCSLEHVLCNSFGFGGNDSSILLSKVARTK